MNLTELSRDDLRSLRADIDAEIARRLVTCDRCGSPSPLWMLHVCDGTSGVNLPLDSEEAKSLTRMEIA
jgi:hypothetical protein